MEFGPGPVQGLKKPCAAALGYRRECQDWEIADCAAAPQAWVPAGDVGPVPALGVSSLLIRPHPAPLCEFLVLP